MQRNTASVITLAAFLATFAGDARAEDQWSQIYGVRGPGSSTRNGLGVSALGDTLVASHQFTYDIGNRVEEVPAINIFTRTPRGWLRERSFDLLPQVIASRRSLEQPRRIAIEPGRIAFVTQGSFAAPSFSSVVSQYVRVGDDWVASPPPQQIAGILGGAESVFDAERLLLSSPRAGNAQRGAVTILGPHPTTGAWVTTHTILPVEGREYGRFGHSIAREGDTLVIGEPGRRRTPDDSTPYLPEPDGRVHIFVRSGDTFVHAQTIDNPAPGNPSLFGNSVAIRNGVVLVGSPYRLVDGLPAGAAYIYERDADAWALTHTILNPTPIGDPPNPTQFGWSVDIGNDFLVIGEPLAGDPVLEPGAAHIYERTDDAWVAARIVIPPADRYAGSAVAASGDNAFFSAPGGTRGTVFIAPRSPECFRDLRADANNDGVVDFADLSIILSNFGQSGPDLPGDLNRDGEVDMTDLNIVLVLFGSPCLPPN